LSSTAIYNQSPHRPPTQHNPAHGQPMQQVKGMSLWEMGNDIIAASKEVAYNHELMVADGG